MTMQELSFVMEKAMQSILADAGTKSPEYYEGAKRAAHAALNIVYNADAR